MSDSKSVLCCTGLVFKGWAFIKCVPLSDEELQLSNGEVIFCNHLSEGIGIELGLESRCLSLQMCEFYRLYYHHSMS